MRGGGAVLGALCCVLAWGMVTSETIRGTFPRRDPTFVVADDPLNLLRASSDRLELLAMDGFDRDRVVVETDGARAPVTWADDRLQVSLAGAAPGTHLVTAGIHHRGNVSRIVSVPVIVGAPSLVSRRYLRAIRVQLPTSLFDDGDSQTRTDVAGQLENSVGAEVARAVAALNLQVTSPLRLAMDLGDRDDRMVIRGELGLDAGNVHFDSVLRLSRYRERRLRLVNDGTTVRLDRSITERAGTGAGALAGGAAALMGAGPVGIVAAFFFGFMGGEAEAEARAQREVTRMVENALDRINRGFVLRSEYSIAGLPRGATVRLTYSGTPIVSTIDGVTVDLDVELVGADGVVPAVADPTSVDVIPDDQQTSRAHVSMSRALISSMLTVVGTPGTLNRILASATASAQNPGLPVSLSRVQATRPAALWGGRQSGIAWSLPDIELVLGATSLAHAYVAGTVDLSVGPDGASVRVMAIPKVVSVGCQARDNGRFRYFPCLDVLGAAVPDLPRRIAARVAPVDLFGDLLRDMRAIPIDADSGMALRTQLTSARSITTSAAYAAHLGFDVEIVRAERPARVRRPGHARRSRH